MIVVTGAAGFIGSNLVHELNALGETEVLAVDDLSQASNETAPKFFNLQGASFADYMDKREFREAMATGRLNSLGIRAILHQGACSNTLEDDGRFMMDNNFTFSKELLHYALERESPLIYASTAAVYGLSGTFATAPSNERPLNVYGFSKLAFDNYLRANFSKIESTVVGLRYFNVYGPRERHKGRMASVIHHFWKQLKDTGVIRMFEGSGGYGNGEQRRDFVFVRDLAKINFHFAGLLSKAPSQPVQAIVNAGTGKSRSFNDVARILIELHGSGTIEYIPFPDDLKTRYQHFTEADVSGLRSAGYEEEFTPLEQGVAQTLSSPMP